jgi:hypothetical protein
MRGSFEAFIFVLCSSARRESNEQGGRAAGFTFSLFGYTLTYTGGSLILTNLPTR